MKMVCQASFLCVTSHDGADPLRAPASAVCRVLVHVPSLVKEPLLKHLQEQIGGKGSGRQVEVVDVTPLCGQLVLAGPRAGPLLETLGATVSGYPVPGSHSLLGVRGKPVIVVAGAGFEHSLFQGPPAWTVIADLDVISDLWRTAMRKV
jgi:hypothetical protein